MKYHAWFLGVASCLLACSSTGPTPAASADGGADSGGVADAAPGDAGTQASAPRKPVTTAAGAPIGPAVTASIGAGGGTLASADGRVTVTVPANAVAVDSAFSIQPITSTAPSAIGASYRIEPHGVVFAAPVTVVVNVPEAGASRTSIEGIGPASRDDQGQWTWGGDVTRDASGAKLSFMTTHFSDWTLLEGLQLRPLVSTAALGSELDLEVIYCTMTKEGELTGLVYECGRDQKWEGAVDWSVNGEIGGDATLGTVKGSVVDTSMGTFTAPATRPTPSVVAVSAKLEGSTKRPKMTVIAQVDIGAPPTFKGTLAVATTGGMFEYTAKGDVTVTPRMGENNVLDDDALMTSFDLNGTLTLSPNELMLGTYKCIASAPTQSLTNLGVTYNKSPIGMSFSLSAVWDVECDTGSSKFQSKAILQWMTGCMPSSVWSMPIADPNKPNGQYTRSADNCTPGQVVGNTSVAWDWTE